MAYIKRNHEDFIIQLLKSNYNSLNIEKFWSAYFLTQKENFEN